MSGAVTHQPQDQEFTIEKNGGSAELAYSTPEAGIIDFTHTYVDKPLRGQGLAEELAKAGLAYARAQQLQVQTSCPFMREFIDSHPEYEDLRAPTNSTE